jgi:signal transduction histidine kinase
LASQRTIRMDWQVLLREKDLNVRSVPVRQIILNLVLNAIAAAHSQVAVRVEIVERNLRVVVRNDGVAFTVPDAAGLAPEPDVSGRLGLGLWVCFRLAQQLNGTLTIKATSDVGDADGTVATLNIPLQGEVTNA